MSSTSSIPSSTSSSPAASTSASGDLAGPASFYKNLFYILIGLLCAFALVSFLSLLRARKRRRQIITEAERLGVLVPGIPGYIPVRERTTLSWAKSDGTQSPDWWDVASPEESHSAHNESLLHPINGMAFGPDFVRQALTIFSFLFPFSIPSVRNHSSFTPLAIIPPKTETGTPDPAPVSALPFFPNHLAYRPESLLPPPPRFTADRPGTLDGLEGECVDVVTLIRMPMQDWAGGKSNPEGEEVTKLWGGAEIGITRLDVQSEYRGT
ncbi:hypothetical protein BCR39DRAFT_469318 [Naematelia encephala]|uniref:Uncharacterized protein n=1 Tax=Naematelia encephala TaxID=71784 RepID=A0A1Y2AY52_9TREE|nr:hypothetical protein BCR39DRAFT_469318 [Naematelia encephala]